MKLRLIIITIFFSLLIIPSAFAKGQKNENNLFYLHYPAKTWTLTINLPGFTKDNELSTADSFFATNFSNNIIVSMSVGEAKKDGSAETCRNYVWNMFLESPFETTNVRNWNFADMAFKNFMINTYEGVSVKQKNLLGCLADNGLWVIIHISKMDYKSRDFKEFSDILKGISISNGEDIKEEVEARSNIEKIKNTKSYEYFVKGSEYFNNKNYKQAINYYKKTFELEKIKRTFGEIEWIVLIDNLGMAYGITGDYKQAQNIFEYGIKQNPRYPMFYYNLACAYGEQNKLNETLKYLIKAYGRRKNMLPGEKLPNPLEDSSFKGFINDKRFLQIAELFNKAK